MQVQNKAQEQPLIVPIAKGWKNRITIIADLKKKIKSLKEKYGNEDEDG